MLTSLTIGPGKCYGPKQVGLLGCEQVSGLQPLINGGGQENNLRSGTENVAGDWVCRSGCDCRRNAQKKATGLANFGTVYGRT